MKKVFLNTAIVLCTICAMAITASAAPMAKVDIADAWNSIVTVSGTASIGTDVSVTVLNPTYDEGDFGTAGAVQYFRGKKVTSNDVCTCGSGGNWCFHLQIADASGDFTIITNVDGVKESQTLPFYPVSAKQSSIDDINGFVKDGDDTQITKLDLAMKNFSITTYELYTGIDNAGKKAIINALVGLKPDGGFAKDSEAALNNVMTAIKEACLIAAYNTDNASKVSDGNGNLLYLEDKIGVLNTDNEFIDYNAKIPGSDLDLINNKSLVMADMFAKTYTSVSEIKDAFKESVRFRVLVDYNAYGFGHIADYFTKYNAYYKTTVGFKLDEFSGFSSKDDIYAAVAGSDAADINALKVEFNAFVDNYTESDDDNNGGSSGGGISFGGGGGGSVPNNSADKEEEKEEPVASEQPAEPQTPVVETVGGFADVPVTHWAAEPIKALAEEGILTGRGNGSFDIDGTITRAELIKIAVISTLEKVDETAENPFADSSEHWAKAHIATAVKAGITTGITDKEFNPDGLITREQAAAILYRAVTAKGIKLENKGEAFADDASISDWAKDGVYALKAAGVISGRDGNNFCASENLTRAEAAKLVYTLRNLK